MQRLQEGRLLLCPAEIETSVTFAPSRFFSLDPAAKAAAEAFQVNFSVYYGCIFIKLQDLLLLIMNVPTPD